MKKRLLIITSVLALGANAWAQEATDATTYSQKQLTGTSRSVARGGAVGATGDDVSAVKANPANIGLYRNSNEIVTTLNFRNSQNEVTSNAGKEKDSKFNVNFDNLAFMGSFNLGSDAVPFLNVGFAYNKIANFNNKTQGYGNGFNSIIGLMADAANGYAPDYLSLDKNKNAWDNNWLAVMGYNAFLIDPIGGNQYNIRNPKHKTADYSGYFQETKGGINTYDISFGTEIEKMISIGATVSLTDIDYRAYTRNSESWANGNTTEYYMNTNTHLKTEGTGYQFSIGALLKPINEFAFGIAYHSPTWYDMTDYTISSLDDSAEPTNPIISGDGYDAVNDYKFRTPERWVFSLASTLSTDRPIVTLSADYELTNNKQMKFSSRDYNYIDFGERNAIIKRINRMSSTLRVGAEFFVTPQFMARIGYAWMQSPISSDFKNADAHPFEETNEGYMLYPVNTSYVKEGDINHITWGLGYRFKNNFFTDIAFIYRTQKNSLFYTANAPEVKLKNNTFSGLLTVGYRFAMF